jgi:hypothetical protein
MASGFIPFMPGNAHAKNQVVKGKPTDSYIKSKHGKNKSGVSKDSPKSTNFHKVPYKGGKARTTERMMKAAQRRLNM